MAENLKDRLKAQATGEKKAIVPKEYLQSDEFINKLARSCGENLKLSKQIVAAYLTSYVSNPALQATSLQSQMVSLIQVSTLGLIPNTPLGLCHIIPYGNEARFQLGFSGIVELCRRAGVNVFAEVVREGDEFKIFVENDEKKYRHEFNIEKIGKVVGAYAGWYIKEGGVVRARDFSYWTLDQIIKHAKKYSKSFDNKQGAWRNTSDPDLCEYNIAMLKKTVLIDALRYAPKVVDTLEIATAIDDDVKLDAGMKTTLDFSEVIEVKGEEVKHDA